MLQIGICDDARESRFQLRVLLERALRAFWGRAVYDGTWPLEEEDLRPLVKKYGLILL